MNQQVQAVVTKQFGASAERVYDAWLDPAWLGRWMFGAAVRDEKIVRLGLEPRAGGRFSFVVNRHGTEIDHVGEYLELDRPRLLVFTWAIRDNLPDTSRVIVEIDPRGDGCEVTVTHVTDAAWGEFSEKAAGAWRTMLDALGRELSANHP